MNKYDQVKIKQINQDIHVLTFSNNRKLYLIGTAHVSAESVTLVKDTITRVKPDTICIELDQQRYQQIIKKKHFENIDIIEIIKKKQLFFYIGQFILASFQKKISERTKSKPGMEFKQAIQLSKKLKTKLILIDRNIGVTLKRAWRMTRFWDKMNLLGSLLFEEKKELENINIEELKSMDVINTMVKTFGKQLPHAKRVLIDERDTYMSHEIQKHLGQTTVAVVGAGHVPGMLKKLRQNIPVNKKEKINYIPPASSISRILPWIIPAVVMGLMIYGFTFGRKDITADVALFWIMANGICTAIGCVLALAHPLTTVSGFIAAPITSLNPTIGAGFVTAFVQTVLVKPRVKDFQQIQEKAFKVRQWWQNRITKIFIVFILSSLGSSIGTFIALPALTKLFHA